MREKIESASLARIDYAELVGADDLQPRLTIEPRSLLAVAVFFGKTRLIEYSNASGYAFKSVEKLRYDFQRDAEDALRQA